MQWDFNYQEKGFSVESGIAKGRKPPDWFLEEPLMSEEDEFYLKAFNILGTSRINGMGAGPLPWDKILEYGIKYGLDSENLDLFLEIILAMDQACSPQNLL